MRSWYFIVLCLIISFGLSCLQKDTIFEESRYRCLPTLRNTHADSTRLQDYLDDKIGMGIPGMVMLLKSPKGHWLGAAGFADLASDVAMMPCNIMRVGSITKTFTAAAIMLLQEKGLLSIDDLASNYLESSIVAKVNNAEKVTIRNLLNHTSGIADYSDNIDFSLAQIDHPTRLWTAAEELTYAYNEESQFAPGAKRNYCNTNFLLLGLIAEQVSGLSGSLLYQSLIFTPLGMSNTSFSQDGSMPESIARGYYADVGSFTLRDATHLTFAHNSMAGGICSTAEDLALFLEAITTPDILLSQKSISEMQRLDDIELLDPPSRDGRKVIIERFGLGLVALESDSRVAFGHGGRIRGYSSFMIYFPEKKTSLIYLMNGSNGPIKDIEQNIYRNEIVDLLFEPI